MGVQFDLVLAIMQLKKNSWLKIFAVVKKAMNFCSSFILGPASMG
jgi:hypothetical protein